MEQKGNFEFSQNVHEEEQSRKILYGDVQSLASTGFAVKCEATESAGRRLLCLQMCIFFRGWQIELDV